MRVMLIILGLMFLTNCKKKISFETLSGHWKVVDIDRYEGKSNPQIFEDFKNDLTYFEEVIFYKDGSLHFKYLNADPKLGTYHPANFPQANEGDIVFFNHSVFTDSTHAQKFEFVDMLYRVEKLTKNKLIIVPESHKEGLHNNIEIRFEKIAEVK